MASVKGTHGHLLACVDGIGGNLSLVGAMQVVVFGRVCGVDFERDAVGRVAPRLDSVVLRSGIGDASKEWE